MWCLARLNKSFLPLSLYPSPSSSPLLLDNPLACFCIHPRATATGATSSIGGYPGMCKKTTIPLAAFATTLCVPQTIVSGIQIFCIFFTIVIESSVVGASIICGTFASLSFPFRHHATDEVKMVTDTLIDTGREVGVGAASTPRHDANLLVGRNMN